MKMAKVSILAVAMCGALLIPQLSLAQEKDPNDNDPYVPSGGGIPIPDDGYDGTLASMACMSTNVAPGTVAGVDIDVTIDQTWVGDLTIKVVPPGGTEADVLTVMSRPGLVDLADDGTGCCGDSSNLSGVAGISFADGNPSDAEQMGATIDSAQFVCTDDGECTFFANPDSGPGTDFSQFIGQPAGGDWQVCVGDSAGGDAGNLMSASVNVTVGVPTTNKAGLALLLALLAGGSLLVMRRKANVS